MRQRKVKNIETRISEHHLYLINDPMSMQGNWEQVFKNKNPIYAEFGCGRGQFIMTMAKTHPDNNYIAFEARGSIILRALEKAKNENPANILFVNENIIDVTEYFGPHELSGIYLNFSDPWPKKRHAKRRLTHSRFLEGFMKILKPGCCIEVKTDNSDLFSFTLDECKEGHMNIIESTDDLHSTLFLARHVTTEYEDKFLEEGKKINYLKIQA